MAKKKIWMPSWLLGKGRTHLPDGIGKGAVLRDTGKEPPKGSPPQGGKWVKDTPPAWLA